jgi:hypothetical protein
LICLPREDGAVLAFVADTAACLQAALALREACRTQERYRDLQPRFGIDLGPVELLEEELGQAYLGGEGRRDADRLMRHVPPGQVSVSRSFFELLARASPELAARFKYQGLLSDTMGRPLGWYSIDPTLEPSSHAASSRATVAAAGASAQGFAARKQRLLLVPLALAIALLAATSLHAPAPEILEGSAAGGMLEPQLVAAVMSGYDPHPTGAADAPQPDIPIVQAQPKSAGKRAAVPRARAAAPTARPRAVRAPRAVLAARQTATPASAKRVERGAAAHPPAPAAVTVRLAVRPWAEVDVDGRNVGLTPPLKALRLAPGRYVLTVRNGTLPPYRRELVVPEGSGPITLAHDFACVSVRDVRCPEAADAPLLSSSRYRPRTTSDRSAQFAAVGRAGRPAFATEGRGVSPAPAATVAAR